MATSLTDRDSMPALARRGKRSLRAVLLPYAILGGFLLLWEAVIRIFDVPAYVVPGVWALVGYVVDNAPLLLEHAFPTVVAAVVGFIIGNALAILGAVLFVHSPILERTFMPAAVALRSVPQVAITPLLLLWLGYGMEPRITVVVLTVFFPTLVNMVRGLRSADAEAFELMRSMHASVWQVLWKVRWFASLPYLFAALKITAPMGVLTAMLAEWIGSDKGLGYLIILSTFQFRVDLLWADIIALTVLSMIAFALVGLVERLVAWWD